MIPKSKVVCCRHEMCTGTPDRMENGSTHISFVPTFQLYLIQVHYHYAWKFSKKQLRYYKYLVQQKDSGSPLEIVGR